MQNSTEVGYAIPRESLNALDFDVSKSSVRRLARERNLNGADLLIGPGSFGALLEEEGFNAVPSPRQVCPGPDKYYSGGYITQRHGSTGGGMVDAIQVETPREARVDGGPEKRQEFARALGVAIARFYQMHYQQVDANQS